MVAKEHTTAIKEGANNTGSCSAYVEYLSKENEFFFNHSSNKIKKEDAKLLIDNHSKGGLGKTEAKWYAPIYSLSETESKFICFKLFGNIYNDYDELSSEEKKIYNEYIRELGKSFQDVMAENFNRQNLGIFNGNDLVYVGVVENQRKYKDYDREVIAGTKQIGEKKEGFNTHIHIIQSRKANNPKKSKISPVANHKRQKVNNFNAQIGFDRTNFYTEIERTFDLKTKYERNIKDTFIFKNEAKNINPAKPVKSKKNDKMAKYYSKEEIDSFTAEADLINYFFSLVDKGILNYERKKGNYFYFAHKDQNSGSIAVNNSGFTDFRSTEKGGKILKAMKVFENKDWYQAIQELESKSSYKNYEFKNNQVQKEINKAKENLAAESSVKINYVGEVNNPKILDYYNKRGISADVVRANLKQVYYENKGRKYFSAGIKNNSGSYNVRGEGFKSVIGEHNDISVLKGNGNVIVFEGMFEYLTYCEMLQKKRLEETVVILNSIKNSENLITFIKANNFNNIDLLLNGDKEGDSATVKILENIEGAKDVRKKFNITNKMDLNDKWLLNNVISAVQSLYNLNRKKKNIKNIQ